MASMAGGGDCRGVYTLHQFHHSSLVGVQKITELNSFFTH